MPSSPFYITRKQNTTEFESILSNYKRSTTPSISYVPVVCRDCLSTDNKEKEVSSQILEQLRMMMFLTEI
jgi:hypothetical protein